jgi:AcrR family transcriptional regulator
MAGGARAFPRRRREEMLRIAAELFHEQGYAATSTADLAARMGIQRGSVYYYFETKEGLLLELIQDVYARARASLEQVQASDADAVTKLRALIEDHVVSFATNLVPGALVINESGSLTPEHRELVRADAEAYERGILELILEGQRLGAVRGDVDARMSCMVVLGATNWVHRWFRPDDEATPDEIGRQFAEVLISGLLPQTATSNPPLSSSTWPVT